MGIVSFFFNRVISYFRVLNKHKKTKTLKGMRLGLIVCLSFLFFDLLAEDVQTLMFCSSLLGRKFQERPTTDIWSQDGILLALHLTR